jgi:hypothetical protein
MRAAAAFILVPVMALVGCVEDGSIAPTEIQPPPPTPPFSTGPAICTAGTAGTVDTVDTAGTVGTAGEFLCSGISLNKRVSLETMGGGEGNDIWGWLDTQSGKEYALMGMTNGTAFVDVSNPQEPVFLGSLPTQTVESTWRDIKVYQDHAYIVADSAGAHGMQVFDLTRLRGLVAPQTFSADIVYSDFESAHNIAINEESGYAYAAGTNTISCTATSRARITLRSTRNRDTPTRRERTPVEGVCTSSIFERRIIRCSQDVTLSPGHMTLSASYTGDQTSPI